VPPVWYDEYTRTWREASDVPATDGGYDVVVLALTERTDISKVARTIAAESGEPVAKVVERLEHVPAAVLVGVGYATAEGVRSAISPKTAEAVLRPHTAESVSPPPVTR
jgi:hypothetical protein